MSTLYNFLFPANLSQKQGSDIILSLRILFGVLLFWHGYMKLSEFGTLSAVFPDPLGLGSELSLSLAIFAEMLCSFMFIIGFLYKLVLLPMIFTLSVAFFAVHSGAAFSQRELAFIYLTVFVILYITGTGRYSIDALIAKRVHRKNAN